jgi:hypothetical protein
MAAGAREACDAVCGTTLGVVLCTWRAAARLGIAADLPGLARCVRVSFVRWTLGLAAPDASLLSGHAHLAPVAGLAGTVGGAFLPGARALRLLGVVVVVDVQVVTGELMGHVMLGTRLTFVVVDGALDRHRGRGVGAGVVVLSRSLGTSVSHSAGGGRRICDHECPT